MSSRSNYYVIGNDDGIRIAAACSDDRAEIGNFTYSESEYSNYNGLAIIEGESHKKLLFSKAYSEFFVGGATLLLRHVKNIKHPKKRRKKNYLKKCT